MKQPNVPTEIPDETPTNPVGAETAYCENGICVCPFCNGRFKVIANADEGVNVDDAKENLTCAICGYTWKKRKNKPRKCPRCQSSNWENGLPSYKCMVCGHGWNSPVPNGPERCPSCRSVKWREPMVRKEVELKDISSKEYTSLILRREYERNRDCYDIARTYNIPLVKVIRILVDDKVATEDSIRI